MQREALIGLTVLLTLAVLSPGQPSEPALAATQAQELLPVANDSVDPVIRQRVIMDTVSAVDNALQREIGPWQIQFVGSGDSDNATLTMQLDVAM